MKIRLSLVFLAALLGVVPAGVVVWAWYENSALPGGSDQVFRVPPGEALSQTAQRLGDQGLVRNPLLFRLTFQWLHGEGGFPSGTFAVPRGMTSEQAAQFFLHAQPIQIRVTVPEGWTATKIARLLEEKKVVLAKDFLEVVHQPSLLGPLGAGLTTLDGRLFPETYLFPLDMPAVEVVRVFVQTFQKRTAAWSGRLSPDQWEKNIVLASIVEREYRNPSEAALVASVFRNRLAKGIPLGSCATIEYILTEIMGRPHPKRIFFVHTEIPSPYNTYLNKGLPPTAISNPGITALKAAFEPVESDYLYFVVADSALGTHTFSSNYASHQKAREAYLNSFVTKG